MSDEKCGTCLFWHSGLCQCRYNAPSLIVVGDEVTNDWGNAKYDDWCGDWESKNEEEV